MTATEHTLADLLETLISLVERESPDVLGSILLADDGHLRHGAAPSLPTEYNEAIDGITIGPAAGSCGTAAFLRERVIVRDIRSDPLWTDFRDLAEAHALRACWSTPIQGHDGNVLGTFALYYREPRSPTAEELRLIESASNVAAAVIERYRGEEERRALLGREAAARQEAQAAEARLADVFRQAPAFICVLRGPEHVFEMANDAYRQLVGFRDLIGRPVREAMPEADGQGYFELLDRVLASGEAFVGRELPLLLQHTPGGSIEEHFVTFVYQALVEADDLNITSRR